MASATQPELVHGNAYTKQIRAFKKSKRVKEFKKFIVAVCQRAILGFGQLCKA